MQMPMREITIESNEKFLFLSLSLLLTIFYKFIFHLNLITPSEKAQMITQAKISWDFIIEKNHTKVLPGKMRRYARRRQDTFGLIPPSRSSKSVLLRHPYVGGTISTGVSAQR